MHQILYRIGEAGGTVSTKKMQLCRAGVEIVGHWYSAKGRGTSRQLVVVSCVGQMF